MATALPSLRGRVVAFALMLLANSAPAQFYAPETQFHDICQRFFPVEAARVLAWAERQNGVPVAEITFTVKRSDSLTNEWEVGWVDGKGKALRRVTVGYARSALTNGPAFYRAAFAQLCNGTNTPRPETASVDAVEKAFWAGAALAGCSRMEGLEAAFGTWKGVKGRTPKSVECAQMAGLLAQTTTHGFYTQSALDGRLLARAAAWLCLAERASATNDSLWPPILFSAGREHQASRLWRGATNDPAAAWWNVLLMGGSVGRNSGLGGSGRATSTRNDAAVLLCNHQRRLWPWQRGT